MEFENVLTIIGTAVNLPSSSHYDGIIVKKLTASNTLDENRTTNQTHIAITGKQMDIFPVLSADQYFNTDYENKNDTFKKYLYIKLPFILYKNNVNALGENTIFAESTFSNITVHCSLIKSRRKHEGDQIQLSLTASDDDAFIKFRRMLHEGDYLILCKHKGLLLYDCFGIRGDSTVDRLLDADNVNKLNNNFFYEKNSTPVELDKENLLQYEDNIEKKVNETKEIFRAWLLNIAKKNDGSHFAKNTVIQYVKSLEETKIEFAEELGKYNSIFDVSVVQDAKIIRDNIKLSDKFIAYNKKRGNGSLAAGLDMYIVFLQRDNRCVDGATNQLFYGVPGCGKSYTVNKKIEEDGFEKDVRVVFHPDYTYYDFVGQISPRVEVQGDESRVKYVFTPGPFTQVLKFAHDNPGTKCLLIIEELNRGNAPAIFGELFQLLDRSEEPENLGESNYGVTNYDIAEYVYGDREHEVKIPSNLSIYATMNTSDQNVFTLDTAFQRRWFMHYIPNKFEGKHAAHLIAGTNIPWGAFATVINDRLHDELGSLCSTEDKSLGAYFATDNDLESKERFSEKVLKYLWDDAFKMSREAVFDNDCKALGDVIEWFQKGSNGLKMVLQESVYKDMVETSGEFLEADVEGDTENSIGE